ncbi:MAG TPA: P-loop NTPase fold protein [Blastocatellia bacterium]|nr:P-loop NTPase fold protein [Blastocatellia bacterium]
MSLEQIKTVVEKFISDSHNELLVIKGKWGVGKTFFWQKLVEESKSKKCIGRDYYSYVSLFGINNLEELKHAIIASRVESNAGTVKGKFNSVTANLKQLADKLEEIPKLREYTGGLVSNLLFHSLDNTLICFDDLERKGDGLDIKDVFGLASVFKEQQGCKVLLIMNDESFEQATLDQFKLHGEKIIDREVLFSITAEESFDYIFEPTFHSYNLIKNCCLHLQVKNIRTLQRIRRFIEDITPNIEGAEERVIEDVFRALVLYVWSYYDKASGAPPLSFTLAYSTVDDYISKEVKKEKVSPEVEKWRKLLGGYNYLGADDVDKCLAEFVEIGYLDKPKFSDVLNIKNEHYKALEGESTYSKAWDIYRNSFDDNEREFVDKLISNFRSNMKILSVRHLQGAVATLREFERDDLANALVDEYFEQHGTEKDIEAFRTLPYTIVSKDLSDKYLLTRLRGIQTYQETDNRSLADLVKAISFKEFFDYQTVCRMNSFSIDDYYEFFKSENSDDLERISIEVTKRTAQNMRDESILQ